MMSEALGINVEEYVQNAQDNLVPLIARAFLYAEGDAKVALARALLSLMKN